MWMVYFSQFEIVETSFVTILMEFNDLGVGNTMKAAAKINNPTLTHLEALVNLLSILLSSKLSIAERVDERWLQSAMFALWQARTESLFAQQQADYCGKGWRKVIAICNVCFVTGETSAGKLNRLWQGSHGSLHTSITDKHYICLFNASEAKVAHITHCEHAAVELLGRGAARAGNSSKRS